MGAVDHNRKNPFGADRVQRQRYSAISTLPLCSSETSTAVLPVDWQCTSAMVRAAAISVSSEYQRNLIASGDLLTVQGGALQAATPSTSTATATRTVGKNIDTGTSLRRSPLHLCELLPIDGVAQL